MWIYRLGLAKAKWHALTGEPLTGVEAAGCGLINEAVPFAELEARVAAVAADLARIPSSQLAAQKLVVNQAYEAMGLGRDPDPRPDPRRADAQHPRRALDSIARAEADGVRAAIEDRDGPFGDYSQAPPSARPDPRNVIEP